MKMTKVILLMISIFIPSFAFAYCGPTNTVSIPFGWYVDGNIGFSKITNTTYGSHTSVSNSGTGYNIDVGYKFMPYFAAEIGYTRHSDADIKNAAGKKVGEAKNFSYDIAAKGILPVINTGFEFFAKLGAAQAYADVSANNSLAAMLSTIDRGKHTATSFFIGVGADYSITPNVPINIQWQRANGDGTTGRLDLYSVGIGYILA